MKSLLFGLLCSLALGCDAGRPAATGANSTTDDRPTTGTTKRPILPVTPTARTEPVDRTNTGINDRDQTDTTKTSFDQNENKADIKITSDIRKQVIAIKMSSVAHNVKIITQGGKVTLRGPVQTEQEKQQIEEIALAVAGPNQVDSQLEVNQK